MPLCEIVYQDSRSPYRCTCPPAVDEADEIRLALACWEQEQQASAGRQRPRAAGSRGNGHAIR